MESAVALLAGLIYAVAFYLLMSNKTIRILIGVALLGNAVNLTLFTTGRLSREVPPIIPVDGTVPLAGAANALPQALILTAIVISFSFFAFLLVLAFRAYQDLGTDDTDAMHEAEPVDPAGPVQGY